MRRTALVPSLFFLATIACAKADDSAWSTTPPQGPAVQIFPAAFDPSANAPPKVVEECELERRLPEAIAQHAGTGVALMGQGDPNRGTALTVRYTNMAGSGGGMWSGAKFIEVQGEMRRDGQVVASFTARRTTTGGAWGGYKGTCSLLARCANKLGEDIAGWLAHPAMNARLGEYQ